MIPIYIGAEEKASLFAKDMFENGVFALPAIYPAVPRGQAVIRTAFMIAHKNSPTDYVLEVLDQLAKKHRIRACDLDHRSTFLEEEEFSSTLPASRGSTACRYGEVKNKVGRGPVVAGSTTS